MTEDSVVALHHPGVTADPLTEVLRAGARELLAQAIEAEVAAVLAAHEHLKTEDGRRRLVRHGHGPERAIVNGGGIMLHARGPGGPVAAAQNCATHGPLSVATRGRRCTAWSSMRRFDWRLSTRV